jgi:hypothetical protein
VVETITASFSMRATVRSALHARAEGMIGRKEEDSIGQGMMGEQDDGVCVGSVVV